MAQYGSIEAAPRHGERVPVLALGAGELGGRLGHTYVYVSRHPPASEERPSIKNEHYDAGAARGGAAPARFPAGDWHVLEPLEECPPPPPSQAGPTPTLTAAGLTPTPAGAPKPPASPLAKAAESFGAFTKTAGQAFMGLFRQGGD